LKRQKNHHHLGRRLLQCFQQGVLSFDCRFVEAGEQGNPPTSAEGGKGQPPSKLPDGLDPEKRLAFPSSHFVKIGMPMRADLLAGKAASAAIARRRRLRAVQRLDELQSQGALSHTLRAGEEVGVSHLAGRHVTAEHFDGPLVPDQVPSHGWILS
jgi:hypothetical protein